MDSGTPRNAPAAHMHGYLSRDGLPPAELLDIGRREVEGYGGTVLDGAAAELVPGGTSGFWVLLSNDQRVSARRLLVATALRDDLPDIQGRPRLMGRGQRANPRAQVITVAGEGSAAALAINADLVDEDVRNAVRDFNNGMLT